MNSETPSTLTARIKNALEPNFRSVLVEGEISTWKPSAAGHAYFNLKDANAILPCAFFGLASRRFAFTPRDGLKVRALGDIGVYAPRGNYQLVVRSLEQAGLGDLMMRLEELKRKLVAEGLFDQSLKRPLTFLPRKIGVVTSPTGAVIRDILNVTLRRFPGLNIVLAPARVQGEGADMEIIEGIRQLNALAEPPDAIIVARGGGSIEDLWCFNSEALARAIRASRVPVISAVGHETDFTICDFAADLRAPTPSAAAEIVAAKKEDLDATVAAADKRVRAALGSALRQNWQRLDFATQRLGRSLPDAVAAAKAETALAASRIARGAEGMLRRAVLRTNEIENALVRGLRDAVEKTGRRLDNFETRLASANPDIVLQRGYAIITDPAGNALTSAKQASPDDIVRARFHDGTFDARVLGGGVRTPAKRKNKLPVSSASVQPDLFSVIP